MSCLEWHGKILVIQVNRFQWNGTTCDTNPTYFCFSREQTHPRKQPLTTELYGNTLQQVPLIHIGMLNSNKIVEQSIIVITHTHTFYRNRSAFYSLYVPLFPKLSVDYILLCLAFYPSSFLLVSIGIE